MHFRCTLDLVRICIESSTAKVVVPLPKEFFTKAALEGFHPIMSYEEVNSQVLGFLREELDKCGWYERFVFRFRGSVVRLLIDGSVARMLSGWELDNLMEFLLQARVLHVGLLSENEGGDQRPNTEQVFLKWPDRIEWKKTIVQSVSLRYSR